MEFREMRRLRQQLSGEECLAVLDRGTSGVLAVTGDGGWPYAVPLSYACRGGVLFWACSAGGLFFRPARLGFYFSGLPGWGPIFGLPSRGQNRLESGSGLRTIKGIWTSGDLWEVRYNRGLGVRWGVVPRVKGFGVSSY